MSKSIAQVMWEAYSKQAGGQTFDGKSLPEWEGLGQDRQECWIAAASVAAEKNLRDWFAGKALQGLLACPYLETEDSGNPWEKFAVTAYELSDAMIAERQKREDGSAE